MEQVLVVDDNPEQARTVSAILENAGYCVNVLHDGDAALSSIEERTPDLVLTDLRMPGLDGLELVERVTRLYPSLPIVLMTAYGSGEIAVQALKQGAASYLPKRLIVEQLEDTVEQVLDLTRARRAQAEMLASVLEFEFRLVVGTDPGLIAPIVACVEQLIQPQIERVDQNEMMRLSLGLQEALLNAVHHGNLEVNSELREKSGLDYARLIAERLRQEPYASRRTILTIRMEGRTISLTVEDQGPGFDVSTVPDPTDPSNLLRCSGRGLYLIGSFMDRVEHNARGNRITMVKTVAEAAR